MNIRIKFAISVIALVLIGSGDLFAKERRVVRTLGTIGGAVLGVFAGYLVSDDDAIEATKKLTRNAAILGTAGGVGGYFLGRAVDKRISYDPRPDPVRIRQAQVRAVDRVVQESVRTLTQIKENTAEGQNYSRGERPLARAGDRPVSPYRDSAVKTIVSKPE